MKHNNTYRLNNEIESMRMLIKCRNSEVWWLKRQIEALKYANKRLDDELRKLRHSEQEKSCLF